MASIATNSSIASVNQLDLFTLPETQGTVEKTTYVDKRTITSNPNDSPLEFNIPESGHDFIDLQNSKLEIKLKIKNGKGSLIRTDVVGPINLLLQSLWSQIDIFMNNTRVSDASTNYAYRAYIPTILSYGTEVKCTSLLSQLFVKDVGGMDAVVGTGNKGLSERSLYTSLSKVVHLIGPLYSDIWKINRWIIPGVSLNLALWRNNDNFLLMTSNLEKNYNIEIIEAKLIVCYCTLQQPAYLAFEAALSLSPVRYPLIKTEVKNYSLPKDATDKTYEDVFAGKIPTKVVVAFVSDEAYHGSRTKNPFNFYHNDASFIGLYQNGIPVPGRAFQPKFNGKDKENAECVDCFDALFSFAGKSPLGTSIDINRDDFSDGYSFFVFNLEHLLTAKTNVLPLYKNGNLRLEIKFRKKLEESIQVLVYAQFPYILKIQKNREVVLE